MYPGGHSTCRSKRKCEPVDLIQLLSLFYRPWPQVVSVKERHVTPHRQLQLIHWIPFYYFQFSGTLVECCITRWTVVFVERRNPRQHQKWTAEGICTENQNTPQNKKTRKDGSTGIKQPTDIPVTKKWKYHAIVGVFPMVLLGELPVACMGS